MTNTKSQNQEYKCLKCNNTKPKDFYLSSNESHKNTNGKLPWCKSCIENQYKEYLEKYGDGRLALYYVCRKFDIFFSNSAYEGAKKHSLSIGWTIIQSYFKQINSFKNKEGRSKNGYGVCFDESWDFLDVQLLEENGIAQNITKFKTNNAEQEQEEFVLSDENKKAKEDVIRLLGYDPFIDYDVSDKMFLYNDLVTYLDDDTVEDAFKCSVVLQIVNNNNQIRKIDTVINKLSSDANSIVSGVKDIDNLASVKSKLNQVNDRLSKENNIALKHRAGSGAQNSTLGSIMKKLREMDFEKAEYDYYDMCKSYGIQKSAEASNKSIAEIIRFDENDMNNMFKMQREEIQKLQDKELNYREEIRLLIKENNELKANLKNKEINMK